MSAIQVLCTMRFTDEQLNQLRAVSARVHLTQETCHNNQEVADALTRHPDTQILQGFYLPDNALEVAPGLRWFQLHSAGADHVPIAPLLQQGVMVTTSSGIHATPIAEYVLASMLAHRWQVPLWTRCQREHQWPSGRWDLYACPELRDSTVGILGYGSIGREVGRLAQAFGMRVLALRRSAGRQDEGYSVRQTGDPEGAIPARFFQPDQLRELLAESDYVVVALPSTAETYHLLGEAELRAMKPTAYLVNIARGAIIDEAALVRALAEGWIAGAGLDVFEEEPLPADSPLWDLENVLITPHVAGFSPRYDERAVDLFATNLARYLVGEPLLNRVDQGRGY